RGFDYFAACKHYLCFWTLFYCFCSCFSVSIAYISSSEGYLQIGISTADSPLSMKKRPLLLPPFEVVEQAVLHELGRVGAKWSTHESWKASTSSRCRNALGTQVIEVQYSRRSNQSSMLMVGRVFNTWPLLTLWL
ncbi:hypothetical protein PFISCL1PPCAC_15537, partial [Pristionchus fissidentatus]